MLSIPHTRTGWLQSPACLRFHVQRTLSLSDCVIDHLALCSKQINRPAARRFEEQLLSVTLSCQPDTTPGLPPFLRASSSVPGTAAVKSRKRPRLAGGSECLRHTTRDEAQLQARQASR